MIETLAFILTGLSIAASMFYYANVLQNQNKARNREVLFQRLSIYTHDYTRAFAELRKQKDWKTPEEWYNKYGPDANPEAWATYLYITRIYNLAGIILQEKDTDPELIFKLFPATAVIRVWEQFRPTILSDREKSNYPPHYEPFECLYNEARRRYPHTTKIS
jgi:hypothetical protein